MDADTPNGDATVWSIWVYGLDLGAEPAHSLDHDEDDDKNSSESSG